MPKKVDHDERREELVRAAWQVIATRGIDELTIRDIARESGYSSGVLAHYFENKDDLLAHCLQLSQARLRRRYEEAAEESSAPGDALEALLLDSLPLDEQHDLEARIEMSFWARALQNQALHGIQEEKSEGLRNILRRILGEAQEEGAIVADHDLDDVLELLGAVIDGLSLHALLYPQRLPPERQAAVIGFALALVGPRGAAADGG